jgi:hypothetical protein
MDASVVGRPRTRPLVIAVALAAAFGLVGCAGSPAAPSAAPGAVSPTKAATRTRTPPPTPSATPASWARIARAPVGDYLIADAVWDGQEMLVVLTQQAPATFCRELVAAYAPAQDRWRILTRVPTPKGCFEGSDVPTWTGRELLLWGISNTAYDPATDRWRHLPNPPAGAGGPSVVVWTGSQMIGWGGGCCATSVGDGAIYTPATNTWRRLPPAPISARHTAGVWTGKELILLGGEAENSGGSEYYRDGAAYDPATNSWRKLPPMPRSRAGDDGSTAYQAVWDGEEVLLIGGRTRDASGATEPLARGLAFDPAANRYRWLPPMRYPRDRFVTAWTGDLLLVWGGTDAASRSNYTEGKAPQVPPFGEAFDPATNTWTALPPSPLRARVQAVAAWTGDEMVIWGGWDARRWGVADHVAPYTDGAALTPPSG